MMSVATLTVLATNLFSRKDGQEWRGKEGGTAEMLRHLSSIEMFSYQVHPQAAAVFMYKFKNNGDNRKNYCKIENRVL